MWLLGERFIIIIIIIIVIVTSVTQNIFYEKD